MQLKVAWRDVKLAAGFADANGPIRPLTPCLFRCGAVRQTGLSLQVRNRADGELVGCRTVLTRGLTSTAPCRNRKQICAASAGNGSYLADEAVSAIGAMPLAATASGDPMPASLRKNPGPIRSLRRADDPPMLRQPWSAGRRAEARGPAPRPGKAQEGRKSRLEAMRETG